MNIEGILNGAVLQRNNDDVCEIVLTGDFNGVPKTSLGKITNLNDGTYMLSEIPVGGASIYQWTLPMTMKKTTTVPQ